MNLSKSMPLKSTSFLPMDILSRWSSQAAEFILSWPAKPWFLSVELSVMELLNRFWKHAKQYYRKPDGTATTELGVFKQVIRPLKRLYGTQAVSEFTALKLQAVREEMVQMGWSRGNINKSITRIRHIFRWGVSQELVPSTVIYSLDAVAGLKKGRCSAKETEPAKPVPQAHIEAVKPHVSRQVWALIQLQLCTGARGGELVGLRLVDLDTSGPVWTYHAEAHKTAHRGRDRMIYIGPRGQRIIKGLMAGRSIDGHLFSPQEAEKERHAEAATHRRPNQKSNPKKTNRAIRETYDTASYRRAIERACNKANVPKWTPHRLRHTAASAVRKEFGLEAAQIILGHSRCDTTQVYAEVNHSKGIQIAEKMG
jgi:integrase